MSGASGPPARAGSPEGDSGVTELIRDFRYSLRLLRRSPGFSAVAVTVLALGIGANTAVFSLVNTLLLRPRPGRVDQAIGVFSRDTTKPDSFRDFSYPSYTDLRDRSGVFESLAAHTFSLVGVREGDTTRRTFASLVSANYFSTLGVAPAIGRAFTADEERPGADIPVAIASYDVWRRAGFDRSLVGRTVRINATDFTVVGVAPRGFAGTMALLSPEYWFPLGAYDLVENEMFKQGAGGLDNRANYALNLAGVLKTGLTAEAADARLGQVAREIGQSYPGTDRDRTFLVAPLPRMSVSSQPERRNPVNLVSAMLVLMAALVLGVACMNLANLLLARGAARRREVAIRQAIGCSRAQIVRQLLVEGLTLSSIGAAGGVVIAVWTTQLMSASLSRVLPFRVDVEAALDVRVLLAVAGFAVFSTIAFALGPAWALARAPLTPDLKGDPRAGRRSRLASGPTLVVAQIAVSLALVTAGGLFVRGAMKAASTDLGFPLEHQLVVGLDPSLAGYSGARTRAFYHDVLDRVRAMPGVARASFSSTVPFGEISEGRKVHAGSAAPVSANYTVIGADFFDTMGLHMLQGREFTRAEEQGGGQAAAAAIVTEPLARKLFGTADVVGRQIQVSDRENGPLRRLDIVGVAPGLRRDLFDEAPVPELYVSSGGTFRENMNLRVRTEPRAGADAAVLGEIRTLVQRTDPRLPIITLRTLAGVRDRSVTAWAVRAGASLFSAFGVLALLLATVGVYGLKAYDVSRRTREIGIRMALGATTSDVQRLVLSEGARTAAVGVAIGLLLAAGVGRLVSGLLYQVSPFDPVVLATAAALLAVAALVASYLPARRATRIVPLEALRTE
jgi:predicted permease